MCCTGRLQMVTLCSAYTHVYGIYRRSNMSTSLQWTKGLGFLVSCLVSGGYEGNIQHVGVKITSPPTCVMYWTCTLQILSMSEILLLMWSNCRPLCSYSPLYQALPTYWQSPLGMLSQCSPPCIPRPSTSPGRSSSPPGAPTSAPHPGGTDQGAHAGSLLQDAQVHLVGVRVDATLTGHTVLLVLVLVFVWQGEIWELTAYTTTV